jgi:hypothetical protein
MKVLCIQDVRLDNQVYFYKNRWYESEIHQHGLLRDGYRIKSDLNVNIIFLKNSQISGDKYLFGDYFQTSEEYREIKLLELGI